VSWSLVTEALVPLAAALMLIWLFNRPRLGDRAAARRRRRLTRGLPTGIPFRFTSDADGRTDWVLIELVVDPVTSRIWSRDPRWGGDLTGLLDAAGHSSDLWPGWVVLPAKCAGLPNAAWVSLRADELIAARDSMGLAMDGPEEPRSDGGGLSWR